jgi:hypothetical protein
MGKDLSTWVMQVKEFSGDLRLLNVGFYDNMILGGDWLYDYCPLNVETKRSQFSITVDDKPFQ